jgi:hypothetical protein
MLPGPRMLATMPDIAMSPAAAATIGIVVVACLYAAGRVFRRDDDIDCAAPASRKLGQPLVLTLGLTELMTMFLPRYSSNRASPRAAPQLGAHSRGGG